LSNFVILIPSHNEFLSLKKILKKIYGKYPLLIMNDCSNDKTKNLKKDFKNLSIINNKKKLGYEKNLQKGFKILTKKKFEYILTFDADGEHHINNLKKVEKFLRKKNKYDLIIGERSHLNRFSEKIISYLFYKKFKITDPLSGLKIYKTSIIKKFYKNISSDFFLVDLIYKILLEKKKIKNFKIKSIKIKKRKSKVGNFFKSNYKILKCLKFIF